MEVKNWEYADFPAFDEEVEGAKWLDTTGDEPGVTYVPDVQHQDRDGIPRVLQILIPTNRNHKAPRGGRPASSAYPCIVARPVYVALDGLRHAADIAPGYEPNDPRITVVPAWQWFLNND